MSIMPVRRKYFKRKRRNRLKGNCIDNTSWDIQLLKIGPAKDKLRFCYYKLIKKKCSREDFDWMTQYLIDEQIKECSHVIRKTK